MPESSVNQTSERCLAVVLRVGVERDRGADRTVDVVLLDCFVVRSPLAMGRPQALVQPLRNDALAHRIVLDTLTFTHVTPVTQEYAMKV